MPDCAGCGQPYSSTLAAEECADMDATEDAQHRRGARRMSHRLQAQRWPSRDDE